MSTQIYIYIYIYICVCVRVDVFVSLQVQNLVWSVPNDYNITKILLNIYFFKTILNQLVLKVA